MMKQLKGPPGTEGGPLELDSADAFQPNVLRHLLESKLPHFTIGGAVVFIGLIGVATIILEANSENR